MNPIYLDSVRLLLDLAPDLFRNGCFALKGGTAINLFVRNLPRLSVDLDLVYLDRTVTRDRALNAIRETLEEVQEAYRHRGIESRLGGAGHLESKLLLERSGVRVKVEVNHVFRGTLHEPLEMVLAQEAQNRFFSELSLPVLRKSELYGSKLVAAMDRQHPRDLFDVLGLYENEGLTGDVVECFVGYLAGHNRPVHEVLFASKLEMSRAYANEFSGMTLEPVELTRLVEIRERLFEELPRALSVAHRSFLMSLVAAEPDWGLMAFAHLHEMPAIRWKLQNLKRLRSSNPVKFKEQSDQLRAAFDKMDKEAL